MSRFKLPPVHIPIAILILAMIFAVSLGGVSPTPHSAGASAGNGRIAYSSLDSSSDFQILSANSDGSDIQQLTTGAMQGIEPSYSPDGTKIAYVAQPFPSGDYQIMIMNTDGTDQVDVSNNDGFYYQSPRWSPDGTKIAFSRAPHDFSTSEALYTMNADGSNQIALTDGTTSATLPSWDNTGTVLSFICGHVHICTIHSDGSNNHQITNNTDEYISASFSPDGTQIAYVHFDAYVQEVGIMNPDGSNQHLITNQNTSNGDISWSPDGTKLVYDNLDAVNSTQRIYYMNLDGSGETAVTPSNTQAYFPSWQPSPVVDSDGDGISTAIEAAGPNGGDANNDGIADKNQANVTSFVNPLTNSYVVVASTCTSNSSVTSQAVPASFKDQAFSYPQGLLNFTLTCAAHGQTATVTQYFYGTAASNTMVLRKYNNTTHAYTTIPGVTITGVTIGGKTATKASYQITDGDSLDQDGVSNGVIIDPVGLALPSAGAPNTGFGGTAPLPWARAAAPSL